MTDDGTEAFDVVFVLLLALVASTGLLITIHNQPPEFDPVRDVVLSSGVPNTTEVTCAENATSNNTIVVNNTLNKSQSYSVCDQNSTIISSIAYNVTVYTTDVVVDNEDWKSDLNATSAGGRGR